MSTAATVQEAPEMINQLEEQIIVDRASVEPEGLDERAQLLAHSKRPFPKRVILLLSIVTLYMISSVATLQAGIDITYRFICYFLDIESRKCLKSSTAGEHVANFTAVLSILRGVLALCVNSYLSAVSDRLGRKPVFVGAMVLTALAQLSSWYIVFHLPNPSTYWWLVVPAIIEGLGGGVGLVAALCVAYVSDMVPDATQRTRLLAVFDGCLFGSLALGPIIGSWIIKMFGFQVLYISTTAGSLTASALMFIFLKESLSAFHKRRNSTTKRSISSTMSILLFDHVEDSRSWRNARLMFFCALFGTEFAMTFGLVLMLYPKRKYGWTAVESGYLISSMCTTRTLIFVFGFPYAYSLLSKWFTVHKDKIDKIDVILLRAGIIFSIVGYLMMAWSETPAEYFAGGIVDAFSSFGMPIYKSALIKHVPQGQFGSYLAAFNVICSVSSVITLTLFLKLYSWSFRWRPYLPFEVVTGLFIGILIISFFLKPFN